MNTAKKATTDKSRGQSSNAIIDDEAALVEKIANDIKPSSDVERQGMKALPAYASEAPNGAPSQGPNEEFGMTAVIDSTVPEDAEATVRMVSADGVEAEMSVANAKMHERSGWKKVED
jgi:hypothetical protein